MKKSIILLLVIVFVTFLFSSCVAGLRGSDDYRGYSNNYRGYNDNYRNSRYYQDDQGNYHRRTNHYRNRHQRDNDNDLIIRGEQGTLIIH